MELVELSALAIAPVVFILTYIYLKDRYEREPLKYLFITFVLGMAVAYPVVWVGNLVQTWTPIDFQAGTVETIALYAFIVVALPEELFKYLVLRWYNYPHKEFDEPYDGIMYGAVVSLGFATVENFLYIFAGTDHGVETAILRMFTAVPAHAAFGVIMGYYVGKAKFLHGSHHPFWERMKGLGAAILIHGLYDYFLFLENEYLVLFSFSLLVAALVLSRQAMKLHAEISPHKPQDPE
ncbi:MAG: PrsW family glutamic-type intramembrane protease [Bacteroidota bacterium]